MPRIDLSSSDGNAFALMGYVSDWGRQLGFSRETINEITSNMRKGSYEDLLTVMEESFYGEYTNKEGNLIFLKIEFDNDPRESEKIHLEFFDDDDQGF